jgi:hypothetical protein
MDVGMFSTVVLSLNIIAGLCLAVAALVISIGEWKIRMGFLPRFKNVAVPRRHQRRGYRWSLLKVNG